VATPTVVDREFVAFPKIPRLFRDIVITEKIDGTNAAVGVTEDGDVYAQSRKRIITPQSDNFGFARWVEENAALLADILGAGLHFGEWWGSGIQRGYGLRNGEKQFSLFNTSRWGHFADEGSGLPGLGVVPVLHEGVFDLNDVRVLLDHLREHGSQAAPGFMNPEGVIVLHPASNYLFKATIHGDDQPKSVAA
jgi:hypothetical protein